MQVKIQFNLIDLSEIQKRDERVKTIRLLQKALLLVFERKWDFVVVKLACFLNHGRLHLYKSRHGQMINYKERS